MSKMIKIKIHEISGIRFGIGEGGEDKTRLAICWSEQWVHGGYYTILSTSVYTWNLHIKAFFFKAIILENGL